MNSAEKLSFAVFSARWWRPALLLLITAVASLTLNAKIYGIRGKYVAETVSEFGQLPGPALEAVTLEFKGLMADYLLFKTMTYMGLKISEKKTPAPEEWQLIYQMLERITDLDPNFWDPYLFAEMMLAWQARMFDEVAVLLEKAARHRAGGYRPHYYLGFNQLYFMRDTVKAAPHLRAASQFPLAPRYIKGLASRVSLYAGQTGLGIVFLEELIRDTSDPKTVKYLEKRLITLKTIYYLEQKVKEYKALNGTRPASLEDLVATGMVPEIPPDPYGGEFVLLENGRVYTTSQMVNVDK